MEEKKCPECGGLNGGHSDRRCSLMTLEYAQQEIINVEQKWLKVIATMNKNKDVVFNRLKKLIYFNQGKVAILKGENNKLRGKNKSIVQSGAAWVKAKDRLPKEPDSYWGSVDGIKQELIFKSFRKFITLLGQVLPNEKVQWLDETDTTTALPTFWDVAKAFKWAAEYRDEKGGQLTLYNDQWTLISEDEDGNENETEDLTPGNVAELYCLQNGFTKEKQ